MAHEVENALPEQPEAPILEYNFTIVYQMVRLAYY